MPFPLGVEHPEDMHFRIRHPVNDQVRYARHDNFAGAANRSHPARKRMLAESADRSLDLFGYGSRRRGIVLLDIEASVTQ